MVTFEMIGLCYRFNYYLLYFIMVPGSERRQSCSYWCTELYQDYQDIHMGSEKGRMARKDYLIIFNGVIENYE